MPAKVIQSKSNAPRPKMPTGLTKEEKSKWRSVVGQLPTQILSPIDVHELTFLVRLLVHSEQLAAKIAMNPDDDKSRRLYLQTFKEVHRLSAVFGLNPADRARLGVPDDPDEPDLLMEFLARREEKKSEYRPPRISKNNSD